MTGRWFLYLIKSAVAGGLLWWLFDSGRLDFSPLLSGSLNWLYLMGFGVFLLSMVPQVLRWRWLLQAQGLDFSTFRVARWVWIGEFFTLVLPGGAGAELSRVYYVLRNAAHAKIAALSTLVFDRLLGLFALLFLGGLSFMGILATQGPADRPVVLMGTAITAMFAGFCFGFALFLSPWGRNMGLALVPRRYAAQVRVAAEAYVTAKGVLARGFAASVVAHLLLMVAFMAAAWILDAPVTWGQVFLVVPLVFIANFLPIAPGGIGIGETAASFLFAQFGVDNGAAIMLIVRIWIVLLQLTGGGVYLFHRDLPKREAALHE